MEIFLPTIAVLLVVIGYFEGKLTESNILLHYYRQSGTEITATTNLTQYTEPTRFNIIWHQDSGKLNILTSDYKDLEVFIPEEDAEWKLLEKEDDYNRSVQLFGLVGHKNVLLKLRHKDQICFK